MSRDTDKKGKSRIPFWRDIRILGILGQILFIIGLILFFRTLGSNFISNIGKLGKAQFICRNGSYSLRCAFDFMDTTAGFGIAESVIEYHVTDTYWQAIKVGLLNTIKVAVFAIIFSTILGVITGIARLSKNWLISNLARWYVELIRNTPLLVQIVFIYFVFFLTLPQANDPHQPLGLPIFLSRRSISFPTLTFMPSSLWIIIFVNLGFLQFQILYRKLSAQNRSGAKKRHPFRIALIGWLVILAIGFFASGKTETSQGFLTPKTTRVRTHTDLETFVIGKAKVERLSALKSLPPEKLAEAAIRICSMNNSKSEVNLIQWLQRKELPVEVVRRARYSYQALESYEKGDCDLFIAPLPILSAEKSSLEKPANHVIVPFPESPIVLNSPRLEKGSVTGGGEITPEFAGLLLGLTIYAGAFIAEIVRAGIQSVPRGQTEAATALGLSEFQKLRLVILPQSLRVIIPPLISEYLGTIKDSSLGIAIGYPDLYNVSYTTLNQSGRSLQVILIVMAIYLTMSLIMSGVLNWYNNKIRFVEK